ncbi:ATP-binding cassette transporter [Chlorella sorokiniana]|uniref:ATP-binding cassette transporter n=1 Tax=Chlorella sorokiniana TaxID=3076 RepID=A0A2P6TZ51_CHLSO|nr:ATP-binding cassette transporter [Chlorella sorokiniana]|eukprot:PRW59338.1 ATP-binding cassette transporter [Chlorella sorokiniana]
MADETPSAGTLRYAQLFRYATLRERGIVAAGCIAAAVTGAATPVFAFMFGRLLNAFFAANLVEEINRFVFIILGIAGSAFISGTLQFACLIWAGAAQANRVRRLYLASLLSQDMPFFDTRASTADLLHALREDTHTYQEAISDKLGSFVQGLACFVGGMIVAFIRGWDLSLVVLAAIPALIIAGGVCGVFTAKLQAKASRACGRAGAIAGEAVSNMRTVAAFGREEAVLRSYASALAAPTKMGEWQGLLAGFTLGATHFVFFGAYALALWYGSQRVADGELDGGKVVSVILACVLGGFALGQAMPHLATFQQGCVAAAGLFGVIERKSAQATSNRAAPSGALVLAEAALPPPEVCRGDLELADVHFAYPARPQRPVFSGLNLVFPAGKSSALVGESGSGKSTVIQLLLRLYDPSAGAVLLDGRDVRSLPLDWLRSRVGLVAQTPTLFASSIFANIALDSGASMEQVVQAAIAANAHGFISKLPNGYDTIVGEKGSNLSGGQKQRIAIARAILRNPQVLLLDEATSALDSSGEKAVQAALEALMPGRTCVAVAHRLSTVVAADAIHVLKQGEVVESGTHKQLLEFGGVYASMAAKQSMRFGDEKEEGEQDGGGKGDGPVVAGSRGKGALRTLRESVLRRGSVRLSVIPQALADKLSRKKEGEGSAAAAGSPAGFRRLAALNRPEWPVGALGLLCALAVGLQMPGFSLALSEVVSDLWLPDPDAVRSAGVKWALVFTGIGGGAFLLETIEGWCFGVMGQRLATRIRVLILRALLRQDISFLDAPENSSGALLSALASDAGSVRGAVGDRVGHLLTLLSCVVGSYVIAFKSSWSMTLVITSILPILIASQAVLTKLNFGAQQSDRSALTHADAVASEAVTSIKTVAAFNMQPAYVRLYHERLKKAGPGRTALISGLGFGCSQFILMGISSLSFWFGGTQIRAGHIDFKQMLTAFFAIFYASFGIAQAQTAFPDLAKAAGACQRVFRILDSRPSTGHIVALPDPSTDPEAATGTKRGKASAGVVPQQTAEGGASAAPGAGAEVEIEGRVELRRVAFAYPTRPQRLVLKEFNLAVPAGTSCALVGESGHGKSTIIGLLERFYEPLDGAVLIDGINARSMALRCLRRQLALVGQEPVMFSGTILDNITFGSGATREQVLEAARAAQALEFIERLPEGLDTRLGDGGSQLSGGQMQRLAIARAILRQPRILLLDEPTSALDSESEKAVQAALDRVMVGRTSLVVAHRLSTITACTSIAAVYRGRVLEQGSHEELLARNGYYTHLWEAAKG